MNQEIVNRKNLIFLLFVRNYYNFIIVLALILLLIIVNLSLNFSKIFVFIFQCKFIAFFKFISHFL